MRYLLLALLLTSCATAAPTPPKPGIQVVYQRVEVPVPVACVDASKIPAEPAKVAGKLTGDPRRDLDTVSASAIRLRSWGLELSAILIACTKS